MKVEKSQILYFFCKVLLSKILVFSDSISIIKSVQLESVKESAQYTNLDYFQRNLAHFPTYKNSTSVKKELVSPIINDFVRDVSKEENTNEIARTDSSHALVKKRNVPSLSEKDEIPYLGSKLSNFDEKTANSFTVTNSFRLNTGYVTQDTSVAADKNKKNPILPRISDHFFLNNFGNMINPTTTVIPSVEKAIARAYMNESNTCISQDNKICVFSNNNQTQEDWYGSSVAVIDLRKVFSDPSTSNGETIIDENDTENINNLTQNFNCIIGEIPALKITCVDVDLYSIGEYLPNDTEILDVSHSSQIKLLKPLFPLLKNLTILSLTNNHHRYITKAFMGLENLESLDLSDNDIMVLARAFSFIPKLKVLKLSNNQIRRLRSISNAASYLKHLQNLTLDSNPYIKYIDKEDLFGLQHCNITVFSLFNTTLNYVEKNSFSYMRNLKILEISINYLNEEGLLNVTCGLAKYIDTLHFGQFLRITSFPSEALNYLNSTKIRKLYMWHNFFNEVPVLPRLPFLESLSLSNCSIKTIADDAFENLPKLKVLYLRGNKLTNIPLAISSSEKLTELYLDSQISDPFINFFLPNYTFKNLTSLEELSLFHVYLGRISRYSLIGLGNLKSAFLASTRTSEIEDHAFETLTSLEVLDLRGNRIQLLSNFTFYGLHNLKHVYLNGNIIKFFSYVYPFQFTPSLSVILLQYNEIESIPKDMFSNQESLEMLIIGRNKLIPWTEKIFSSNATLKVLGLSQNNIDYITEIMLKEFHRVTMYLDLSKNPFNCSRCGMKEFQDFCLATNLSLKLPTRLAEANFYSCTNPDIFQNKDFFEVELPHTVCVDIEASVLNIMMILLSCLLVTLSVFLFFICYMFRWYIRYWIFHLQTSLKNNRSSLRQKNYVYDAFIIYSSCDTNWVVNYLIPALENQEPFYKLCIHQRDFQVGRQITENILESIENSRKVILILTEGFIKSDWCMYELHLAQHKLFGDTRDILILVKLKAIDRKLYTKNVSYIEKTRRCFMWTESNIGQKLFWNQIRKQLGSSGIQQNIQAISEC